MAHRASYGPSGFIRPTGLVTAGRHGACSFRQAIHPGTDAYGVAGSARARKEAVLGLCLSLHSA